ncbi:CLUMA_CG006677, isoform A [Clunio marinus]|uniref:CLUMA_CG006677, isoform A n=1 Tax=Clunio marinus TaxID=568069 RepID=A0A1J1HYA8_9DIPT|nr:CLUMA_CG006677, isoform A [Clunio marinus]
MKVLFKVKKHYNNKIIYILVVCWLKHSEMETKTSSLSNPFKLRFENAKYIHSDVIQTSPPHAKIYSESYGNISCKWSIIGCFMECHGNGYLFLRKTAYNANQIRATAMLFKLTLSKQKCCSSSSSIHMTVSKVVGKNENH